MGPGMTGMGRRNDGGRDAGMAELGRCCARGLVRGLRRSTPHLTSPLKGGRDEFARRLLIGGRDELGMGKKVGVSE